MSKIAIFNLEGKQVATQDLPGFDVSDNAVLLAQAANTLRANRRQTLAHSKNRGEVSGGGRKPFKQKGTGNARSGSTRSPLWIGGGVTFGPTKSRNFKKRIPAKMNNLALKMVLAEKIKAKKLIILDKFELPKISTKQVYEIFSKLPIEEGKILVILPELNANTELSLANIPYAKLIKTDNLNLLDLSKFDYLLTSTGGLEKIKKVLP